MKTNRKIKLRAVYVDNCISLINNKTDHRMPININSVVLVVEGCYLKQIWKCVYLYITKKVISQHQVEL